MARLLGVDAARDLSRSPKVVVRSGGDVVPRIMDGRFCFAVIPGNLAVISTVSMVDNDTVNVTGHSRRKAVSWIDAYWKVKQEALHTQTIAPRHEVLHLPLYSIQVPC